MSTMKMTSRAYLDGARIINEIRTEYDPDPARELGSQMHRFIFDTNEAAIREGLVRLGWTPPPAEDEHGRVIGCEDCAHNGRYLCDTHGPEPIAERPWPKAREVARIGDMHQRDAIRVGLDKDNDAYISVSSQDPFGHVEFCTPGHGGGKSPRTREALIALMIAIEQDNAVDPSRDWWRSRGVVPE